MEYAAASWTDPDMPPRILGTGEAADDARWKAEQWLDDQEAYIRQTGESTRDLDAQRRNLKVLSAQELQDRYQIDLAQWEKLGDVPAH